MYADYRKSQNKEKFYEEHRAELSLYDTVLRTLKKSGGNKSPYMILEKIHEQKQQFKGEKDL